MSPSNDPNDPSSLSLKPSSGGGKTADFSDVKTGSSTVQGGGGKAADFSDVQTGSSTVQGGGAGTRSYTVEKGDNLSAISKRIYGKSKYWKQIFDANRDSIENPDLIYPGQTLTLPAIDVDGDGDPD